MSMDRRLNARRRKRELPRNSMWMKLWPESRNCGSFENNQPTGLSERRIPTMRRLCRRYLKSSTTREIFTRVNMKAGIALLVSLSGRRHSWLTENVPTAEGKWNLQKRRAILQAFQISGPADKTYRGESGFYTACFQTERDAEQFLKAGA